MRVAVFGGSFDPPHRGHERILLTLLDSEIVDQVRVVPAQDNPFKRLSAAPDQRLLMLRAMMEGLRLGPPACVLDERQIRCPQEDSCTLELMRELRSENPQDEFWFVIGGDLLDQLPAWHRSQDLLEETDFILVPRGEKAETLAPKPALRLYELKDFTPLHLSSSEIRYLCRQDGDCQELLSPAVWAYIRETELYKD
jgi:nicotinate-nucleotide adenylyltransferase